MRFKFLARLTSLSVQQKVKVVNEGNFDDTVKSNSFLVIDCWASWCGPCRMLSPIIDELAEEYSGKVAFGKLNVDENANVSLKFQIAAIPTLLFFKKGKLVDTLVGALPKSALKGKIDALK
ncbi:MAG: thioredoxin [Candidatus Bathyarchaeota archaeon]